MKDILEAVKESLAIIAVIFACAVSMFCVDICVCRLHVLRNAAWRMGNAAYCGLFIYPLHRFGYNY